MKLNIVMVEPEIPQNTGNIARTCAAIGAKLHLVKPLGFEITDKYLKRAGLDYWDKLEIEEHENLKAFLDLLQKYIERTIRIPMREHLRSLNLSNSVAIVAYEILRQVGFDKLEQISSYFDKK